MYKVPIRLLLVEDSLSDATLLQQMLPRSGQKRWELVHVERLSEAIDTCSTGLIDVVLLDLSLPDSDGLETIAEFHAAAPDIPIVVLTGFDNEDFALEAVATGAQDYLVKGQITAQLLLRTIHYAIERGQILRQLQESERRFRGIFDQTFQSMRLLSPEGIIQEINQTAFDLIDTSLENCLGKFLWELDSWNYAPETCEWLKRAITNAREGQFIRKEVQVRGASDEIMWIDFSLKPLKDEMGKVVLLIAEGRDISEIKRAETEVLRMLEQERQLNELKTSFISMVSHEFRNPMTTIQSCADLLQRYNFKWTQEKQDQFFERIQKAINNMLQLLDEVLLLGKAESGKLKYQPTLLNLENFCRDIAETFQINAGNQNFINFTCQGECKLVKMDEFLLQHILPNLLSNAIKYSLEDGIVQFNLTCQDALAIFQVKDQGIGIPLKEQENLFGTFHRCSNVGQIKGTGLGLSIVKKCVDLHKGQIEIQSEIGMGTTFTVKLPLHPVLQE